MLITLIGYRGSGKSTVAGPLAERLGCDWIDADDLIEQRAGRSIREIFAQEGESFFRELERDVIADLVSREKLVVAAGGGAVLDETTRRRIRKAGSVIWLKARIDVLLERIEADTSTAERRPDLTTAGGRLEIEQLLRQRTPLYAKCATLTVETDDARVEEIVERILQSIGDGGGGEESC